MRQAAVADYRAALARMPYFSGIDPDGLTDILRRVHIKAFETGAEIVTEGAPAHGLYLVLEGQVRLIRTAEDGRSHVLRVLGPGTSFNDGAVFDGGCSSESAITVGSTVVAFVPKADMNAMLVRHPEVARTALRIMAERQRSLTLAIEDLALRDVTRRVARLLLGCAGKHGHIVDKAEFACSRITHQEIASMVGSVREVVQRVLKDLETAGAISLGRGHIEVRNRTVLERIMTV